MRLNVEASGEIEGRTVDVDAEAAAAAAAAAAAGPRPISHGLRGGASEVVGESGGTQGMLGAKLTQSLWKLSLHAEQRCAWARRRLASGRLQRAQVVSERKIRVAFK